MKHCDVLESNIPKHRKLVPRVKKTVKNKCDIESIFQFLRSKYNITPKI